MLILSFVAFAIDIWLLGGVLIRVFADLNPVKFFKKVIPAQIVAFSTQASVGTLPVTTRVLQEDVGISTKVANFTAPLGTTMGMPGCAGIWPIFTAIYGINVLGIEYGVKDYIILGLVCLLVSLGTAGVPGTATITTTTVLVAVGLPIEILLITMPIAAIADTGRTATNVTAAMIASAIVGRQENEIDDEVFNGTKKFEPDDDVRDARDVVTVLPNVAAAETISAEAISDDGEYHAEDEGIQVGACAVKF
jgi:Na+/H+-dicarboxylate symporter